MTKDQAQGMLIHLVVRYAFEAFLEFSPREEPQQYAHLLKNPN